MERNIVSGTLVLRVYTELAHASNPINLCEYRISVRESIMLKLINDRVSDPQILIYTHEDNRQEIFKALNKVTLGWQLNMLILDGYNIKNFKVKNNENSN